MAETGWDPRCVWPWCVWERVSLWGQVLRNFWQQCSESGVNAPVALETQTYAHTHRNMDIHSLYTDHTDTYPLRPKHRQTHPDTRPLTLEQSHPFTHTLETRHTHLDADAHLCTPGNTRTHTHTQEHRARC